MWNGGAEAGLPCWHNLVMPWMPCKWEMLLKSAEGLWFCVIAVLLGLFGRNGCCNQDGNLFGSVLTPHCLYKSCFINFLLYVENHFIFLECSLFSFPLLLSQRFWKTLVLVAASPLCPHGGAAEGVGLWCSTAQHCVEFSPEWRQGTAVCDRRQPEEEEERRSS